MIDTMRRRLFALILAPLALVPLSGCGYSLAGRGSALPVHIKTIGVPLFTNATSVFDVEQTLTSRVRLEFIGRGRYKVVPDDTGTDAVLKGDITGISIRPTAFDSNQQASRYEITVVVKVEFRDVVNDKVLYENPAQTFKEEYEVTTGPVGVRSADLPRPELERARASLGRLRQDGRERGPRRSF